MSLMPLSAGDAFQFESFGENDQEDELFTTFIEAPEGDQSILDELLDEGFTWEEGLGLMSLREHIYDIPEVRERMAADPHILFARWLCAQGVFSEGIEEDSAQTAHVSLPAHRA